ncbi:hypothetical protein AVDCRST_MAG81-2032 [uncultured Synechococcales cyanobacterium]|uniref:Uncharacterized protein n=1 Tax=uncultured Synechococcales cyanobacterium TaxID=1936017 RepID=A0A6J4VBP5_9CYAN|nr:hypothetical protein AVDCRST_MAG81-2032 [uncultured Synechococcales cyanobacterium]
MGWLRLHRLWGVEAAIANREILQAQLEAKYPDRANSNSDSFLGSLLTKTNPYSEVLSEERTALQGLIKDLEYDLAHLSKSSGSQEEWFEAIQESLGNARRARPNEVKQGKAYPIWNLLEDFLYSVEWDEDRGDTAPTTDTVTEDAKSLIETALKRIKELEKTLSDLKRYDEAIQQATSASKGLQNPEMFSRYERHITRQLHEALDRLSAIIEQRNQRDSISSFGQINLHGMPIEKAGQKLQQVE